MKSNKEKKATTREITGWTILLILAIIVLVVFAIWLLGDYSEAGKSIITNIKSRFIGIGV